MKKIIVPIDFSPCSLNALAYAVNLSQVLKSEIVMTYISTEHQYIDIEPFENLILNVNSKLHHLFVKYKKQNINLSYLIKDGKINDSILEIASSKEADLIVMGTHGANLNETFDLLYGTQTSNMVAKNNIPILVIPENFTTLFTSQLPIILATNSNGLDFIPEFFIELIQQLKIKLDVVQFIDQQQWHNVEYEHFERLTEIQQVFSGVNINLNFSNETMFYEELAEFALNNHTQLIAIVADENPLDTDIFNKNAIEHLALFSKIPFLSIPQLKQTLQLDDYWH